MKKNLLYCLSSLIGLLCSCQTKAPLSMHWEMGANDVEPGVCEMYYTLANHSCQTFTHEGWALYCGFMSVSPIYTEGDELKETKLVASYHRIEPTEAFQDLKPGQSRTFKMRFRGNIIRQSSAPEGFFLVQDGKQPISIPCTYAPFTRQEQMKRGIETWEKTPYADGEYVYSFNEHVLAPSPITIQPLPIFPQPKRVEYGQGQCAVKEAVFTFKMDDTMPEESYCLAIEPGKVTITTRDEEGAIYARQTLAQLGDTVQTMTITDWPDLNHRGVMLDIVRNFYPVDSVKRILDVMASMKLNVLHFHLTDDEAWRLEIPGLPELTQMAARRGFDPTETTCLAPVYNGGWNANDPTSTSNGYLTRAQYIDLLQYAKERAIRVIPEVDMPGHMRACKKAMHGLLTDSVLEARPYVSAQNYTDNVIAMSNPYAVEFVDKVITEIVKMHEEAGCPLTQFNIGGDEVPNGALTKEEHQTFIDSVLAILNRYHLQPMGWEEIGHFVPASLQPVCYAWHSNDTKPRELAEAGYPVVIASATHFYFDFAYCNHHEEKGLNWGGYSNEYSAFDWEPLIHDMVIGMNAQLWSEVIRSFEQVEWQLFPKMYGLSERAWNNRSDLTLAQYNGLLYETMLPRLATQGHAFHIQQPGIHTATVENGTLLVTMNKVMQGGVIRYQIDNGDWQEYTEPFALTDKPGVIRAQIEYLGRKSNTTWCWL